MEKNKEKRPDFIDQLTKYVMTNDVKHTVKKNIFGKAKRYVINLESCHL
jgi:hypothetical protein